MGMSTRIGLPVAFMVLIQPAVSFAGHGFQRSWSCSHSFSVGSAPASFTPTSFAPVAMAPAAANVSFTPVGFVNAPVAPQAQSAPQVFTFAPANNTGTASAPVLLVHPSFVGGTANANANAQQSPQAAALVESFAIGALKKLLGEFLGDVVGNGGNGGNGGINLGGLGNGGQIRVDLYIHDDNGAAVPAVSRRGPALPDATGAIPAAPLARPRLQSAPNASAQQFAAPTSQEARLRAVESDLGTIKAQLAELLRLQQGGQPLDVATPPPPAPAN